MPDVVLEVLPALLLGACLIGIEVWITSKSDGTITPDSEDSDHDD